MKSQIKRSKKGLKRKFWKIILINTLFISFLNSAYGQLGFCCFAGAVSPHSLSYQYGIIDDKSVGKGIYQGIELMLYYDIGNWDPFCFGLKTVWGKSQTSNSNTDIIGCFFELDWYPRDLGSYSYLNRPFSYLYPYAGVDIGISGGFTEGENKKAKFAVAPIIGLRIEITRDFSMFLNSRYLIVFDKSIIKIPMCSVGFLWDLTHWIPPAIE